MVGLLRSRNVWRNAHSTSSKTETTLCDGSRKLLPVPRRRVHCDRGVVHSSWMCGVARWLLGSPRQHANGGPAGENRGGQATTGREFAADKAPLRMDRLNNVAQHTIDGVFVEDTEVAVSQQIHLQGFELQAALSRQVANGDDAIVRKAGFRADRRVLGETRGDHVAGKLIRPGFERRKLGVDA